MTFDIVGQKSIVIPRIEDMIREYIVEHDKFYAKGIWDPIHYRWENITLSEENELRARMLEYWIKHSKALATHLLGEIPYSARDNEFQRGSEGYRIENTEIEGTHAFAESRNAMITGCALYGDCVLDDANYFLLRDSIVSGFEVLSGETPKQHDLHKHREPCHLMDGVEIENSLVLGKIPLLHVQSGTIRNSVICGIEPLKGAKIKIENSYVISPEGVKEITALIELDDHEWKDIFKRL